MASIQCAIELYDGVSPVLQEMGLALEGFSGRMLQFGEEMDAVSPDVEGIVGFRDALGGLAEEGQRAHEVLANVLASSKGLSGVFSEELFAPLMAGAGAASAEIEGIGLAAEETAAALLPIFSPVGLEIAAGFKEMAGDVRRTFDHLGGHAAAFAKGLPGHFSGPLAQISGMFASMAASARASMNTITGSAASAVRALSSVSAAASTVQASSFSAGGGAGVSLMSFGDSQSAAMPQMDLMSLPDSRRLELPEPEVYLSEGKAMAVSPAVVTLTVQNENHIASEVDAEALLQELEIRLAEAVASSAEGVYI